MQVKADVAACECYANCVVIAPEIFEISDGRVSVLEADPPAELHGSAREAVENCPVAALWIEE
jgi:ferredoxin